jgi:hypothetical protein
MTCKVLYPNSGIAAKNVAPTRALLPGASGVDASKGVSTKAAPSEAAHPAGKDALRLAAPRASLPAPAPSAATKGGEDCAAPVSPVMRVGKVHRKDATPVVAQLGGAAPEATDKAKCAFARTIGAGQTDVSSDINVDLLPNEYGIYTWRVGERVSFTKPNALMTNEDEKQFRLCSRRPLLTAYNGSEIVCNRVRLGGYL